MAQHKLLTHHLEERGPELAKYKSHGGYEALRIALEKGPEWVNQQVVASEIRGRGGAGFPTGKKWSLLAKNGKDRYFITNCDESEPGTFKDRLLMERLPHLVLEGTIIGAFATGAKMAFLYIRGEYAYSYTLLVQAVKEAYAAGILGKSVAGSNYSLDVVVHRGAGAYICGEETALIESLEGKKGQPRLKPPFFPAVIGLYGCPTIVNNTETVATIPAIVEMGGEKYAKIGVPGSRGTKLISASGNIRRPGVYEVDLGYNLLEFINNECGGLEPGREIKALIPGGSSVNVLKKEELTNLTLDFDSLKAAGSALGSAGFIVIDDSNRMIDVVSNLAHFYAHESCGQCTPCREGGHWVSKIFDRIKGGNGLPGDEALVLEVCSQIKGHTICAFGDTMVLPYESIIRKFPEEFSQLIQVGKSQQVAI